MPNTEEQRLDVIANCDVLLNTILKPFAQTDDTAEGRMIAQLKWLKERAEHRDLPLPVDNDMLSTLRYVYTNGDLCRHASSRDRIAIEVENPLDRLMHLTKRAQLLLKPAYNPYAIRYINALLIALHSAPRTLNQYEQGLIEELKQLEHLLAERKIEPPIAEDHSPKWSNYYGAEDTIGDLPLAKRLYRLVDDLIFNGTRPDTWLTIADADCETASLQAAYLHVPHFDLAATDTPIATLVEHLKQRATIVPSDMTQAVTLELCEQVLSHTQLVALARRIVAQANGLLDLTAISFLRGSADPSQRIIGIQGGLVVYRLGPLQDVLAFFTCLQYFVDDVSPEELLPLTDRLYRRYVRQTELDATARLLEKVQALFTRVSTRTVAWRNVGVDAQTTQLDLNQPTLADIFARYFERFQLAKQATDWLVAEGRQYQPLRLVNCTPPEFPVLTPSVLQHFDDLNGLPVWAR